MGDMMAINHIIVPVCTAWLHFLGWEFERGGPFARLGTLGKWELAFVGIPCTDDVDCLDLGADSERKGLLSMRRHYC